MNHKIGRWLLPIILLVIFVAAQFIPVPQIEITGSQKMPYVSHGLPFTFMPPKQSQRVILIGNSVFQSSKIDHFLQALEERNLDIEFDIGNFGVTGASIGDYVVVYNYVKQFDPDLVIFHLHPLTFGKTPPLYRHESKKYILHPQLSGLWNDEILQTFSKDDLAESVFFSYLPFIRQIPIWRHEIKDNLNKLAVKSMDLPVMNFFPHSLSPGEDWVMNQWNDIEEIYQLPEAPKMLQFLIKQLEADQQQAIFIQQPTRSPDIPMTVDLNDYFSNRELIQFYDWRRLFQEDQYTDDVHPNEQGSGKSALLLFRLIERTLTAS